MTDHAKIQTIVAATDFSEDSDAAVEWAAAVARDHRARLVLAHAVMMAPPTAPEFIPLDVRYYAELRDLAKQKLKDLAAKLRDTGLSVDIELTIEPIVSSIVSAAKKHGADVVVAGTRGLTGWKRLILGSVAARLVRDAPCPVVTLHAADAHRHRPVRTILLATDFSDDASLAAEAACRILGDGSGQRLILLHVYRYPVMFTAMGAPIIVESIESAVASARREMAKLGKRLEREGLEVETRVDEGLPAQAILTHAEKDGADLIAMGTHGRSGIDRLLLGSTAARVLPAAPCPVLTVRGPK